VIGSLVILVIGNTSFLCSIIGNFGGEGKEGRGGGVRMSGTQCAEVIQVIRTKENIGDGTVKDPVRIVIRYWDFEGNLLAENDSFCK